jgi:superfamily II DNA or RNA helicase
MLTLEQAEARLAGFIPGFEAFLPHQRTAFEVWEGTADPFAVPSPLDKLLVFYPTGTGKSLIMLTMMAMRDVKFVVVIAPPVTHDSWVRQGEVLGLTVLPMSHAKFRMTETKMSRTIPVIVDEFHLLGGHTGKGWKKLDRMARGLKAPLILGSATPNYNDAERCYCLVHVLNPLAHSGGFLGWLYEHCETTINPFGSIPNVTGFKLFGSAADFLAAQPNVVYIPDNAPDIIVDVEIGVTGIPDEFEDLGLIRFKHRIAASRMEKDHSREYLYIVDPATNRLRPEVWDRLEQIAGEVTTPIMVFCAKAKIARVLAAELAEHGAEYGYVDGKTPKATKLAMLEQFKQGAFDVLVGTATIATGADGIDKMCDTMVILNDTPDSSLRRQLVGRILPRGVVEPKDYIGKVAYRFVYEAVS